MKYWAFLSYSHTDAKWGDWLHKALETYRVPRRLIGKESRDGTIPARLFPIFRDREELPVSADLPSNINEALRESRYLIVVCSPRAAQSRWVGEEIKTFKKLGREDRILALIIDGEPHASDRKPGFVPADECFPEPMRYRLGPDGQFSSERTEPIAADAREGKDGKNNAKLKLLAGLLGVNYDELKQREQRRTLRRRVTTILSGLLILALVAAVWVSQEIKRLHLAVEEQKRRTELQEEQKRVLRAKTSDVYLNDAIDLIEKEDFATALAYLGSAVRYNTHNNLAVFRLTALLSEHNFWTPIVKPMRHPGAMAIVRLSPNTKQLVTTSAGEAAAANIMQIWDANTGEPVTSPMRRKVEPVFNREGTRIIMMEGSGIRVLDAATGKPLQYFQRPGNDVLNTDGNVAIFAASNTTPPVITLLDTETGKPIATLPDLRFNAPLMSSVSFSGDSSRLLLKAGVSEARGLGTGHLALWDIPTQKILWGPIATSGFSSADSASLTPDGRRVVLITSTGKRVQLIDARTGKLEQELDSDDEFTAMGKVSLAKLSPDAKTLLSIEDGRGRGDMARTWGRRFENGKWKLAYFGADSYLFNLILSSDGRQFLELPRNGVIRSTVDGQVEGRLCDRDLSVLSAEFSKSGKELLTGSELGKVRLWSVRPPVRTKTILMNGETVGSFAVSQNADRIAVWSGSVINKDGALWLLDGSNFHTLAGPIRFDGTIPDSQWAGLNHTCYQFSPNAKLLAVAAYEGAWQHGGNRWREKNVTTKPPTMSVSLLNGDTGKSENATLTVRLSREEQQPMITWSGDSSKLAVVTSTVVICHDLRTGQLRTNRLDGDDSFISAQFSPDGNDLYIFHVAGVSRWDLSVAATPAPLIASNLDIAALSVDGEKIATASSAVGGAIQMWDAKDGKLIAGPIEAWSGTKANMTSLAFSPDNRRLVATTWQGAFRVWDTETGKPLVDSIPTHRLYSARFFENGNVILTRSSGGIDFWSGNGRHLAEQDTQLGYGPDGAPHPALELCAGGRSLLLIDGESRLVARPVPGLFCDAPDWLADLAEQTCGWHLDDEGMLKSIEDVQPQELEAVYSRIRSSPDGSSLKDWAMTLVVP